MRRKRGSNVPSGRVAEVVFLDVYEPTNSLCARDTKGVNFQITSNRRGHSQIEVGHWVASFLGEGWEAEVRQQIQRVGIRTEDETRPPLLKTYRNAIVSSVHNPWLPV